MTEVIQSPLKHKTAFFLRVHIIVLLRCDACVGLCFSVCVDIVLCVYTGEVYILIYYIYIYIYTSAVYVQGT